MTDFLHRMNGHTVTIEQRNSNRITGKILQVQDDMTCHLENVTLTSKSRKLLRKGDTLQLLRFSVRGSTIRHFELPKNIDYQRKLDEMQEESLRRKHTMHDRQLTDNRRQVSA